MKREKERKGTLTSVNGVQSTAENHVLVVAAMDAE